MHTVADIVFAPKAFIAKRPRVRPGPGRRSLDLKLECPSIDGELYVYVRQNTKLMEDYSTGLRWEHKTAGPRMLVRVNGSSHAHGNPDGVRFRDFHIHVDIPDLFQAPVENLRWGYPLGTPFTSLPGAFRLLVQVAMITTPPLVHEAVQRCSSGHSQLDLDLDPRNDDDDADNDDT